MSQTDYKKHVFCHKNSFHLNKKFVFDCSECHKQFKQKANLNRHKSTVHLNVRYVCDWSECHKQYKTKNTKSTPKYCSFK